MSAAILGIYGNSKAEAMYPFYTVWTLRAQKLDGHEKPLLLALRARPVAPVNAFWSVTMYGLAREPPCG
jgi:hypothetical protein